jgi:FAD/FMN-containing dehydrogenase
MRMTGWSNWSGSVAASPRLIARPRNADELAALVGQAGKVRVVGAGHSFMPLCETSDLLLNLSDYEGAVEIAPDRKTVWAPAGWSLKRLTAALWAEGLSLINQGDINPQSLAGAISTGTHGTGAELGSLSTQACGFRLMTAERRDRRVRARPEPRTLPGPTSVARPARRRRRDQDPRRSSLSPGGAGRAQSPGRGRRTPGRVGRRHPPHGVLRLSVLGRRDLQDPASRRG